MCGRYVREASAGEVAEAFEASLRFDPAQQALPSYNIAPTQPAMIVRAGHKQRELAIVHWGLVPSWAKDPAVGQRMINARAETVASRPAYRGAFRHRRCLVPATGFYEWAKRQRGKQPYLVRMAGRRLFAFAGLWEHWQSPEGSELETFTIITTDANAKLRPVHDRMPVMLTPEQADRWLDAAAEPQTLQSLLAPPEEAALELTPVSRMVNTPANDRPECVQPVAPPDGNLWQQGD